MAVTMLSLLIRNDIQLPTSAVELFTRDLVNDSVKIRKVCIYLLLIHYILRFWRFTACTLLQSFAWMLWGLSCASKGERGSKWRLTPSNWAKLRSPVTILSFDQEWGQTTNGCCTMERLHHTRARKSGTAYHLCQMRIVATIPGLSEYLLSCLPCLRHTPH